MTRRILLTTLTAMGISTAGVGAIVAAAVQQQTSAPAPQSSHPAQKEREHIQPHQQHLTHQASGNTGALQHDYAEHAVVEDGMYPEPIVGRAAIMARKGTGLAAVSDFQLTITNRVVHGNQLSAEWVATGTHPLVRPIDVRFNPTGEWLYILDFGYFEMDAEHGVVAEARSGKLWRTRLTA